MNNYPQDQIFVRVKKIVHFHEHSSSLVVYGNWKSREGDPEQAAQRVDPISDLPEVMTFVCQGQKSKGRRQKQHSKIVMPFIKKLDFLSKQLL